MRKEKLHISQRCGLKANGECCVWWAARHTGRAECWWSTMAPHSGQQEAIMISLTFSPIWPHLSKLCTTHSLVSASVLWTVCFKSTKSTLVQISVFHLHLCSFFYTDCFHFIRPGSEIFASGRMLWCWISCGANYIKKTAYVSKDMVLDTLDKI